MRALTSNSKARVLVGVALICALAVGGWYAWRAWGQPDAAYVTVTTDRLANRQGDAVRVTIQNRGASRASLYCPSFCALGNFPTRVEAYGQDGWEYWLGYCPSVGSPFDPGVARCGRYLRHILAPSSSLEVQLANLGPTGRRLERETKLRIVYYVGRPKQPVYSNEFTVAP